MHRNNICLDSFQNHVHKYIKIYKLQSDFIQRHSLDFVYRLSSVCHGINYLLNIVYRSSLTNSSICSPRFSSEVLAPRQSSVSTIPVPLSAECTRWQQYQNTGLPVAICRDNDRDESLHQL